MEGSQLVIAGVVVDQTTNAHIGQARISLAGRAETYITDDLGNFRIDLPSLKAGQAIRVQVTKSGYRTFDETVTPPVVNYVIQLQRQ
jgi:hypothetical protein